MTLLKWLDDHGWALTLAVCVAAMLAALALALA